MTCGSTSSWRSAKCLTSTALSRASSGGAMATRGSARRRERRSGRRDLELARGSARGEQHRQLVLARQVQQVEQRRARRRCRRARSSTSSAPVPRRTGSAARRAPRPRVGPHPTSGATRWRGGSCRPRRPQHDRGRQCGQSGQRSTMSAAAWLDRLTRKSSAPSAGRCGRSKTSWRGAAVIAAPRR